MRQEERSYLNRSLFPEKGEDFIIYIDIQNDLKYRWSLDRYVLISTSLQKSIADKGMVSYIIKKDSAITSFELKDNKYLILTYTDNEGNEQSINIDLSVVVVDNYVDLISNQDIGGTKTFTEKTLFKKDINVSGDGIFGGEIVAIAGDGTPVGVTDYSALTGKPFINGKELTSGENTLIELGIQPAGNYALQDNLTAHTEDNTRHILEEERTAWNNKWDYNEEAIKNILANNYVDLINNQDIGGIKTFIDKTIFKKDISVSGDAVVGGEVAAIAGEGTPAGVTDYSALTGKPSINGKELVSGNNTLAELGIQPAGDYITESLLNIKLDNYATKTFISNNYAGKSVLNDHIADSVKHITDEERTAWNNKSDLTAEDVKGIKVNNAGHADSADNATKAGSADKLTNSRKIFGLPFDGTKDVDGGITANGDSVIRGNLNVTKDGIFGGEVVAIAGEGTPAGVTNYAQLQGKPSINGKELASGDNSLDALGIQPKGDYTTASQLDTILKNYVTKVFASNNYASKSAVNDIQALIPATATADNQLADKDFVNSSIATATAEFKGSFTSLDELKATSGNLNDYAFYLHNDSVGNSIVDRYKWTTAGWLYEYTLNNSSFTAEQWAALNSTITATLVQSYNSHLNNTTIHITAAERTAWNNKWDYNEDTIKGVKVNAAVNADTATSAGNADTLDSYHASSFYKHATAFPYGSSEKPWHKIATFSQSTVGLQINTSITFYVSEYFYTKSYGIFTVRVRAEEDSTSPSFLTVDFLVNAGISKSDIVATWKNTGDGNIVINVYANRAGWSSFSFRKIEEQAWGSPQDKWTTLNASQGNENCYSSIPSDENQVVSTNIDIYNNAASATKLATARKIWGKYFDGSGNISGDLTEVDNITASGKATIQGDIVCGGEVVAVAGEGTPVGVTDYSALTGKPAINGVTLVSGNNTLVSLGIQPAGDYATNSGVTTLLADYAKKTFVSNNYVGKSAFNNHTADTNIHITSAERTAWNAKWNYDEATIKAVKVTSASSADSVAWSGIKDKPSTFTPSAHTHTASDVSGLPTSLKNPYALTFGSKTYDGSAAATITAADLGALTSITKSMVEGVLTGDITSHTHSYLPLSGGTLNHNKGIGFRAYSAYDGGGGWGVDVINLYDRDVTKIFGRLGYFGNNLNLDYIYLGIEDYTGNNLRIYGTGTNDIKWGNNNLLHAGNYNTYAPTLTGTGASGTWGINISGNAATATKLATPRTIWGQNFDGTGNVDGGITIRRTWSTGLYNEGIRVVAASNEWCGIFLGTADTTSGCQDSQWNILKTNIDTLRIVRGLSSASFLEINNNGNILIGTTTDLNEKLQVYEKIGIQPLGGYSGIHFYMNTDTKENWYMSARGGETNKHFRLYYSPDNSTFNALVDITKDGNVLMGTMTDNGEKLQVSEYAHIGGNILIGHGAIGFNRNTYKGGRYDTNYQGWQIDIGGDSLNFFTEGVNYTGQKVIFKPNGNVLIGTKADNGYKLQVNGSERVYGDLIVDGEVSALVA